MPKELAQIIANPNICKVGLAFKDDLNGLRRRRDFKPTNCIDLQSIVCKYGIMELGLQKIFAIIFGQKISKAQQLTNWEADVLTEAQKRYAATDAWACIQIYEEMQQLNKHGYMLEIIPEPESQCAPVLTEEERAQKEERRKEREREKRRRKRQREKEQRSINARRKGKEKLKELLIS
jgi:ribonuclease D